MKRARTTLLILLSLTMLMALSGCHDYLFDSMLKSLNGHSTGQPR